MTQYRTPDGRIADTAGAEHLTDDELYQILEGDGVFLLADDEQPIELREMTTENILGALAEGGFVLARHVGGGEHEPCLEWHILPVHGCTVADAG